MTPASLAARRYFVRAGAGYVVYLAIAGGLVLIGPTAAPLATGVAVAAAVAPVLAVVALTTRYLARETDPMQRDIQLEALIWAVGVTFAVATGWGVLGRFAHVAQVPSFLAFAVFGLVVASVQVARRLFPRAGRG